MMLSSENSGPSIVRKDVHLSRASSAEGDFDCCLGEPRYHGLLDMEEPLHAVGILICMDRKAGFMLVDSHLRPQAAVFVVIAARECSDVGLDLAQPRGLHASGEPSNAGCQF